MKNNKKYNHYGAGRGKRFEHPLYDEYLKKIDGKFTITLLYQNDKEENDILETLKLSIENGKDFYTNAKPYMKEKMEEYNKLLEEGALM